MPSQHKFCDLTCFSMEAHTSRRYLKTESEAANGRILRRWSLADFGRRKCADRASLRLLIAPPLDLGESGAPCKHFKGVPWQGLANQESAPRTG
jgi:hypothetical protein